jgi:hypothetical protein
VAAPNPYAAPGAPGPPPERSAGIRLFGPWAIAAHALLLTPLVGSLLALVNHRRRGDAEAVRRTAVWFVLPSLLILVWQALVSARFHNVARLAGFAWSLAVARTLYYEHRILVDAHVAAGGKTARWYLVTVALFVILFVVVGVWSVLDPT